MNERKVNIVAISQNIMRGVTMGVSDTGDLYFWDRSAGIWILDLTWGEVLRRKWPIFIERIKSIKI